MADRALGQGSRMFFLKLKKIKLKGEAVGPIWKERNYECIGFRLQNPAYERSAWATFDADNWVAEGGSLSYHNIWYRVNIGFPYHSNLV